MPALITGSSVTPAMSTEAVSPSNLRHLLGHAVAQIGIGEFTSCGVHLKCFIDTVTTCDSSLRVAQESVGIATRPG